ncbi:hypothetical protein DRO64_11685 [Candidatus Bathyarchaeota archaeon]|nr:MAG: hypothetical protein DRO64_11685 [Candidatus Bathyarchaeota archaeon]
MSEIWYFAYGWSMDKSLMRKCIGEWIDSRRAELRGYKLSFNAYSASWRGGVANLVEDEGSKVYGAAYKITDEQLRRLDGFEGLPSRSSRMRVKILVENIGEVKAFTHVAANPREGWIAPSRDYLSAMIRGLKQHGLGEEALREVRRAARISQ